KDGQHRSGADISRWGVERSCERNCRTPPGSIFGGRANHPQFAVSEAKYFMKIDHIGIAVKTLSEAAKTYEDALGLKRSSEDQVEEQGVRLAMLDIEESRLELHEPTRPDSPIGNFLPKHGDGCHHIRVRVENNEMKMSNLKAAG